MHDQDRKFVDRWERQRKGGRWIYGLTNGPVFGFVIFIILNIWNLSDQSFSEIFLSAQAFNQLISMILGGILGFSLIAWGMNERTYEKIMEREKNE